jgi:hypothetical protein
MGAGPFEPFFGPSERAGGSAGNSSARIAETCHPGWAGIVSLYHSRGDFDFRRRKLMGAGQTTGRPATGLAMTGGDWDPFRGGADLIIAFASELSDSSFAHEPPYQ